MFGQSCGNKAPLFDSHDTHIPHFVPKSTIEKVKLEMIKKNSTKPVERKIKFGDNESIREKTVSLMRKLDSLLK